METQRDLPRLWQLRVNHETFQRPSGLVLSDPIIKEIVFCLKQIKNFSEPWLGQTVVRTVKITKRLRT